MVFAGCNSNEDFCNSKTNGEKDNDKELQDCLVAFRVEQAAAQIFGCETEHTAYRDCLATNASCQDVDRIGRLDTSWDSDKRTSRCALDAEQFNDWIEFARSSDDVDR